jgi:glycerol-3-phosphate O-acyltransferase
MKFGAWVVTKGFRRMAESITVDLASFEDAREQVPEGESIVFVPSHRSYMDFVLVHYLTFVRPDLNLAVPHAAAASDFKRIPVIGRLFSGYHAFYVARVRQTNRSPMRSAVWSPRATTSSSSSKVRAAVLASSSNPSEAC